VVAKKSFASWVFLLLPSWVCLSLMGLAWIGALKQFNIGLETILGNLSPSNSAKFVTVYLVAVFSAILLQFAKGGEQMAILWVDDPPISDKAAESRLHFFAGMMSYLGERWVMSCVASGFVLGLVVSILTYLEQELKLSEMHLSAISFVISLAVPLAYLYLLDITPQYSTKPTEPPSIFLVGTDLFSQKAYLVTTRTIFLGFSVAFGIAGILTSVKLVFYPDSLGEAVYPLTYDATSVIMALLEVTGVKKLILQSKGVLATRHGLFEFFNIFLLALVLLTWERFAALAIVVVFCWQVIRMRPWQK